MGFTPPFDTEHVIESVVVGGNSRTTTIPDVRAPHGSLRFGGLMMDVRTGVTYWRGRMLDLSLEERELMGALLRHAGQIISTERFATLLGEEVRAVDARMIALRARLKHEGVTCLPCRADGLGYVLWRG